MVFLGSPFSREEEKKPPEVSDPIDKRAAGKDKAENPRRKVRYQRGFDAAKSDRLFSSWRAVNQSADAELYIALRTLRARSRDMAINDDYVTRFLKMCKTNVVGPAGIGLQNRARDDNGALDVLANAAIEKAWKDWGRKGICTVDGRLSWIDATGLFIQTTARDGECLVRMRQDLSNIYGFALEFIDADRLDENYNDIKKKIRLGIEYNDFGRPVYFHILKKHPAALQSSFDPNAREKVPAAEIIHGFVTHRCNQGRGYPWTAQSLRRLKMLGGYEESELVASRVAASKMGFFLEPEMDEYVGDETEDDFNPVTTAEPGTFDRLPAGTDFKEWKPDHPVAAFESFVLAVLRGAASGLGVSYIGLSNDLRGVSYSSIRQGALEERDHWRTLQTWMIEHFAAPVFAAWLRMALTTGALNLPPRKIEKFHAPVWRPRGWSWIDPLKEVKANVEAIQKGLKSLQAALGEQGIDVEDILEDNKVAEELAAKYGSKLKIFEVSEGGQDNAGKTE